MALCHQFAVLPSPHLPREFSYLCRWASPTGPTLRCPRPGEFPRFRSSRSRKLLPALAVDPRPGMVLFDRDTDGNHLHMVGDHLPPRLFRLFRLCGVPPGVDAVSGVPSSASRSSVGGFSAVSGVAVCTHGQRRHPLRRRWRLLWKEKLGRQGR